MARGDGAGGSGSGKGKERAADLEMDDLIKSDIGWRYATPIDGNKSKTQCNFCEKQIKGGGITRFKHHLTGGDRNVSICTKCPPDIRNQMKESFNKRKEKEAEKARKEKIFKEVLFHTEYETIGDSSDEEMDYPSDIDTDAQRRAYRRALKESRRDEEERRELASRQYGHVGGASDAAEPALKKQKSGLGRSSSMRYVPSQDPKQRTVKGMFTNARDRLGRAVSKYFFLKGIPANAAAGPWLQQTCDEIVAAGTGAQAPTPKEIMGKWLQYHKQEITLWINNMKQRWGDYGVTIMSDGWTSYTRKQIINFLVYCDGTTIFLRSVDASDIVKDHKYILRLLKNVVDEVGKEHVVQVVTDNGSNFKKAGKLLMESKEYGCFWTPCAAHCIDLILKDFGSIRLISQAVTQGRTLTTFIYNHGHILSLMRQSCGGDLIRPGVTRFATNYLALQSIVKNKVGLKAMFSSREWYAMRQSRTETGKSLENMVATTKFWDEVSRAVSIMEPVVLVLRMVDGDKKPTMGSLYEGMNLMRQKVKEVAGKSSKAFLKTIDERWTNMLLHPLHQAAYYLNPKYQYSQKLGTKPELLGALQIVVERLVKDPNEQTSCMSEVKYYRDALMSFGRPIAINSRKSMLPAEWWLLYGVETPSLRRVAINFLSQTASAGGCERNWSTFNLIHSQRRNSLGSERLHDLVYVNYNSKLKEKYASLIKDSAEYMDPIDVAYIFYQADAQEEVEEDVLQAWMNSNGDPLLDEGGRPNEAIAEKMGVDLDDHMAGSGRRQLDTDILSDRDLSSSHTTVSGSGNGGDDGDSDGEEEENAGRSSENSGHPGHERYGYDHDEPEDARRRYRDMHTNIHGQFVQSPERRDQPSDSIGYDPYYGSYGHGYEAYGAQGYGSSHDNYGYGHSDQQQYGMYGGQNAEGEYEDLTSSIGSMSISMGGYASGGMGAQGYEDQDVTSGSSFNIFPTTFPPPPMRSPPRHQPEISSSSSRTRGTRQTEQSTAQPEPNTSSSRGSSRDSRLRIAGYEEKYPRIGMMLNATDIEYKAFVMDYQTIYSYMTWPSYVEYQEAIQRHEQAQRWRGNTSSSQSQQDDPPRNSSWW